jgi:uncharacterized damage-inducible protein DinB
MELGTLQELFEYNTWANTEVLDTVEPLEPGQFTRALGGSFPSIQATLTHVLWAEWLWLGRWRGGSPTQIFTPEEFPSVPALRSRWREVQAEQRAFLSSLDADRLKAVVRYTNLKGETWQYPLWRQLYHLLSHSTYHRGQVTTLLRLLDVPACTTDFLNFCDESL